MRSDGPVVWNKSSILFSACNEDTRSELRAFRSLEGQRALCVTAGGGRVLSLLLDRPKHIVAVDLNPAQNALLELKLAALRQLDHHEYLSFLGVRPDAHRLTTYERLRSQLSPGALTFFDRQPAAVAAGILFQGKLERFLSRIAKVMQFAYRLGVRRLLDARDIDAQRAVLSRLETPMWRAIVHTLCRRQMFLLFSGDPGFFRYLPPDLPLHSVLYDRIFGYLRSNLLRDNPLLQICFFGKYVWEPALPVYLHESTYARVQSALEGAEIEIVTGTVNDVLAADRKGFDAYSLSDIGSYLDDAVHHQLFERVLSTALPGARVCSRSNIHHRTLAPEHSRRFVRDSCAEQELARRDHACVHDFLIGTLS